MWWDYFWKWGIYSEYSTELILLSPFGVLCWGEDGGR